MDELDWTADRRFCWGLTARVVIGFAALATVASMAGLIGTAPGELATLATR